MNDVCVITDTDTMQEMTKSHDSFLETDQAQALVLANERLPTPAPVCYPAEQVQVDIYMYHYVRPTRWDAKSSVVYGNSITPETAREHYSHLNKLQSEQKIHISYLSELEVYQTSNCFPHPRIVILTFDDGRWDNYHFLLPLAREFDIKANLGIIANRIAFDENGRIDSFMLHDEIRRLIDSGYFEIQWHSGTHTNLQAKWRDAQRSEICESTKYLEKLYDVEINSFIYPMWLYNSTSVQVARDCGLTYALTTIEGNNSVSDLTTYPFQLSRYRVNKWVSGGDLFGW